MLSRSELVVNDTSLAYGGISEAVTFGLSARFESSKETGKVQIDKIHPFAMEKRIRPRWRRSVSPGKSRLTWRRWPLSLGQFAHAPHISLLTTMLLDFKHLQSINP